MYRLRGIGPEFATVLPLECFYKDFANRRELAAFAGLAPTPWASGSIEHEQGVSKAHNRRLRKTMVKLTLGVDHAPARFGTGALVPGEGSGAR